MYVFVVGSAYHIDRRSSHLLGCVSDMLWPLFPDPRAWALAGRKCLFGGDCGVGRVRVAVMYVYSFVYVFVVGSVLYIDCRSSHRLGRVSDMLWPLVRDLRTWALAGCKCLFGGARCSGVGRVRVVVVYAFHIDCGCSH